MGIGSFIKRKVLNYGDDDDDDDDDDFNSDDLGENDFESERKTKKLKAKARDVKAALLAIKEDLEAASRLTDRLKSDDESNDGNRREGKRPRIRQKVVVSETTPLSSSSLSSLSPDSTTNPESVRQRIDRVRSGEMTDVERKAFLEAALRGQGLTFNAVDGDGDGGNENVGEDDEEIRNGSGGKRRRPEDVPSPFPTDPLYATAVGGYSEPENKESSLDDRKVGVKAESRQSRSSSTGRKKMSEKERLKYLEMVTDPKRFNSYITMGGGGGGGGGGDNGSSNTNTNTNTNTNDQEKKTNPVPVTVQPVAYIDQIDTAINDTKEQEIIEESNSESNKDSNSNSANDGIIESYDLASRLGRAAEAHEEQIVAQRAERDAASIIEIENMRVKQAEIMEAQRIESERRRAEIAEVERLAREEEDQMVLEQQREEGRRMEELMRRQEEYWTNKVAEERAAAGRVNPSTVIEKSLDGIAEANNKKNENLGDKDEGDELEKLMGAMTKAEVKANDLGSVTTTTTATITDANVATTTGKRKGVLPTLVRQGSLSNICLFGFVFFKLSSDTILCPILFTSCFLFSHLHAFSCSSTLVHWYTCA